MNMGFHDPKWLACSRVTSLISCETIALELVRMQSSKFHVVLGYIQLIINPFQRMAITVLNTVPVICGGAAYISLLLFSSYSYTTEFYSSLLAVVSKALSIVICFIDTK